MWIIYWEIDYAEFRYMENGRSFENDVKSGQVGGYK